MIIANPIYDVVFKYLLEDLSIAHDLLTTIIGEEVIALEMQPQETVLETAAALNIFRVDFRATIRLPLGDTWKVLIELQKAKRSFDITRFRQYLGENYQRDDGVMNEDGVLESRTLPIVTIYFLGFKLPNTTIPVLRISRVYQNAATGAGGQCARRICGATHPRRLCGADSTPERPDPEPLGARVADI